MGSTLFTAIAMSAASVACVIHYLIVSHGVGPSVSWHYIGLVAGCAFFATVLPSFLISAGLVMTTVTYVFIAMYAKYVYNFGKTENEK